MIDYLINIDWLAVSVYGNLNEPPLLWEAKATDQRNRLFSSITELHYNGDHVATIQHNPTSPLLKPDLMICKFENHILYRENWYEIVSFTLQSWNMKFNNVNRCDIAIDFQRLNNAMTPEELISNLFVGSFIRKGARQQLFHGADKNNIDRIYTTKQNNLVAYFNKEVNFNSSAITGYRCGSRASAVCVYLYNKSLELKQQKDKPYIRQMWQAAGFDMLRDTWRLEFSIKGKQFDNLKLEDLKQAKLFNLADSLVKTYFEIRVNDGSGNFDKINLFAGGRTEQVLQKKTRKSNADKSAKLFISRMIVEIARQRDLNEANAESLRSCLKFALYEYVQQYGLVEYGRRKLLQFNLVEEYNMLAPAGGSNISARS